jgi:hypothetical protein
MGPNPLPRLPIEQDSPSDLEPVDYQTEEHHLSEPLVHEEPMIIEAKRFILSEETPLTILPPNPE